MVSANLKDWKEVTKGIYRYVISANVAYEIHIKYWDMDTDILSANASLYIVGDWRSMMVKIPEKENAYLSQDRLWLALGKL